MPSQAIKPGAPQLHPEADGNLIFDWAHRRRRRDRRGDQGGRARDELDIVNNRLVPNAMEPRAALGHYDKAEDHYTCWTTSQNPHVARLVMSAFYNVAPENKLRVIAPDVGGGFGSKIFIYPEEIVCLWASKKTGVPVKWVGRPHRELPHRRAWPRPCHASAEMAFDADNKIIGLQGRHDRQSRRLHVAVLVLGADLSLRDAAVGPVRHPGDPRQCARGLHQHRARSTPIAAPGGRKRPIVRRAH